MSLTYINIPVGEMSFAHLPNAPLKRGLDLLYDCIDDIYFNKESAENLVLEPSVPRKLPRSSLP